MFCKRSIFILLLIIAGTLAAYPDTSIAAANKKAVNSSTIQEQINILLAKIKILQLELEKIKLAETKNYNLESVNTSVRQAVVNILCEAGSASPFKSISGSGVIIDARGVILTNAHIGQYFLIKDYPTRDSTRCIIRAGSPASPAYEARLMYLPPVWIQNNYGTIKAESAIGTGENDYALLAITGSATSDPLPAVFPYVPFDDSLSDLSNDEPVLLASYPGELVGSVIIKRSLSMSSAVTKITQGYYFEDDKDKNLDLLDVSGTVISQAGSSGGAAVSLASGKLIGIIVTATEADNTSSRELRAVTISHINRSMEYNLGRAMKEYLLQPPLSTADNFDSITAPIERSVLVRQ